MAASTTSTWLLGARSETGYVRSANEDRMAGTRTAYGNVYVVSDGMGGYRGGALAAELVVGTLRERLSMISPSGSTVAEQVRQAFAAANQEVYQRRRPEDPDTRNMGATGVALVTWGAQILVGHVGDSRAYLWRKRTGLKRLTRDHTRVQKMLDAGLVSEAQAAVHPDASVLDRAIGHQPTVEVDVSPWMTLRPGEMVLLCSDGLCGYVEDEEIATVLRSSGDPQTLAHRLVDCALMKGGEDNVTVQLVRFGGASGTPFSEWLGKPGALLPITAVMSAAVAWAVSTGVAPAPAPDKTIDTRMAKLGEMQAELIALKATATNTRSSLDALHAKVEALKPVTKEPVVAPPAPASISAPAPAPKTETKQKKPASPTTTPKGRETSASSAAAGGTNTAKATAPAASSVVTAPAPAPPPAAPPVAPAVRAPNNTPSADTADPQNGGG